MGFQSEGLKQINGFDCAFPVNAGQVVQGSIPYPESFSLGTGSTEFFNLSFIGKNPHPPSIKSNRIDEEYVPLVFKEEVVGEQ